MYYGGFFENLEGFEHIGRPSWVLLCPSTRAVRILRQAGIPFPPVVICTVKAQIHEEPLSWEMEVSAESCTKKPVGAVQIYDSPAFILPSLHGTRDVVQERGLPNGRSFDFADLALAYHAEFQTLYDEGLR